MSHIFVIENQSHAEQMGEFNSLRDAWAELGRLSVIDWDERPNVVPCPGWRTCDRDYEIIEYETSAISKSA